MSFFLQGFYFFIIFFLVFFNHLSKFIFFCQTVLSFNSIECFSHFNVQQQLSHISHFVLFSQAHLKIILKAKTLEKIYFIQFYCISNTSVQSQDRYPLRTTITMRRMQTFNKDARTSDGVTQFALSSTRYKKKL